MIKRIIKFLAIILILTGCYESSTHKLEGSWIGYEQTLLSKWDTFAINFHSIFTFNKDSLIIRNYFLDIDSSGVIQDTTIKYLYQINDSVFIINNASTSPDTLMINLVSENKFILSDSDSKYSFSRLLDSENEPSEIDFTRKTFSFSSAAEIIDTFEFINESEVLLRAYYGGAPGVLQWKIRNYQGYNLLVISDPLFPLFLIQQNDEYVYELKRELYDTTTFFLTEFEAIPKMQRLDLIGNWTGHSNTPNSDISFYFGSDSVQMNDITGREMITCEYSINLSGDIVFLFNEVICDIMFYKIHKVNNDSLLLSRLSQFEDTFVITKVY